MHNHREVVLAAIAGNPLEQAGLKDCEECQKELHDIVETADRLYTDAVQAVEMRRAMSVSMVIASTDYDPFNYI